MNLTDYYGAEADIKSISEVSQDLLDLADLVNRDKLKFDSRQSLEEFLSLHDYVQKLALCCIKLERLYTRG